jgi:hypothetical protein
MMGRELAEKLKGEKPQLKVIYTSGYSANVVGKGPSLVEGINFLQKPYHLTNSRKLCGIAWIGSNTELRSNGGGEADEAIPECARPRAQQLASFKPRNISQPPAHHTWLRPGRPHSANA